MSDTTPKHLITPSEAAVRLGLDRVVKDPVASVLKMARRGLLRSVSVGRFRMIVPSSIDDYIDGRTEQPGRIKALRAVS